MRSIKLVELYFNESGKTDQLKQKNAININGKINRIPHASPLLIALHFHLNRLLEKHKKNTRVLGILFKYSKYSEPCKKICQKI
jgi:hypothetical protein